MNLLQRRKAIQMLEEFRDALLAYRETRSEDARSFINRTLPEVYSLAVRTKTLKFMSISPPPAVGGVVQHLDVLNNIFTRTYRGVSIIQAAIDSVEQTIGVLQSGRRLDDPGRPNNRAGAAIHRSGEFWYQLTIVGLLAALVGFVVKSLEQTWLTVVGAALLPVVWFMIFKAQSPVRASWLRGVLASVFTAIVGASVLLCVVFNDELAKHPGALAALQVVVPVVGGLISLVVLRVRRVSS